MALVNKTVKIDLWQRMRERITVVQREILGRSLTFQLCSGALPVNLNGCSVTFYAIKPDTTIVFNACQLVTAASGICSYTVTEQTILLAGDLTCQLVIVDSSANELRTQEFTIEVQASSDFTSSVESSSEYNAFAMALASYVTINAQANSYTLGLSDSNAIVDMAKATAQTLTVPKNSAVAFPVGTQILVRQKGAGQVTISPVDGDVTLNSSYSANKTTAQYSVAGLIKVATDTWSLFGDLEA